MTSWRILVLSYCHLMLLIICINTFDVGHIITLIYSGRLYQQMFVGGLMFYLCYMCLLANSDAKYVAIMSVRWRVSYKRQGLLTIREHLSSVCLFVFCLFAWYCFYFVFYFVLFVFVLCLVCSILTGSLDCLFFFALLVFFHV